MVTLVYLGQRVLQASWESVDHRALLAHQGLQEKLGVLEMLANLVPLESLEPLDQWESVVLLDPRVCKVFLDPQVSLERQA